MFDTNARVQAMVSYAQSQPPTSDRRYFCAICDYPLTMVTYTIDDNNDGHLDFTVEPSDNHLLPMPSDSDRCGYLWYRTYIQGWGFTKVMNYTKYETYFNEMVDIINDAIRENHGILCNKRRSTDDVPLNEKVLLHISDVIIMFVHDVKRQLGKPQFVLVSDTTERIDISEVDNPFIRLLTDKQKRFLFYNADYFIVIYSYWSNFSFLPCRLAVPSILVHANSIHANPLFYHHQAGKLAQIGWEQHRVIDKSHFML